MRISDWSSDVCSSDLPSAEQTRKAEQSPDARLHSLMACVRRDPADEVDEPLQVESATFPKALEDGEIAPPTADRSDHHILRGVLHHPAHRSEEHTSELQSLMRITYAVFCLKTTQSS